MVLEKTLGRVLWTARRSNQSILKEINPEYSLEGLTLKLKLQYFSHLMQRANSMDMSLSKLWEIVKDRGSLACCSPWGHQEELPHVQGVVAAVAQEG